MDIHLGAEVRDMITGYEGVVIARIEHLFGVSEIKVQQRSLGSNDRPLDPVWFEEARLELKPLSGDARTKSIKKLGAE